MKLNWCLCGQVPLEVGVHAIGYYDVGFLMLEIILAVYAGATHTLETYFTLPIDSQVIWAVVLKIVIVDFLRVCAFGLLHSRQDDRPTRLGMGVIRVLTQGLWVFLLAWCLKETGLQARKLVFNILCILLDLYFTAVIFSYYRTTTQEEIEIELKRLSN